jgi:aspartokinase
MRTIQEAVTAIINKTPFIEEALYDKLINVSSLARIIKPEVETMLKKEIKDGAIMMAINRLSPSSVLKTRRNIKKIALSSGDFIMRSDLCDYTFKNTPTLVQRISKLLNDVGNDNNDFLTISQGVFETNIVVSKKLKERIDEIFKDEITLWSITNLASITIKLPKTNIEQSGIYYFILKQLAWADISVQEVISTTHEITIVVKETDIKQAFSILMDMKLS